MAAPGARPVGALDDASAARSVRQMFDSIAPRYDLLNHLLSANVDRLWWRRTARCFQAVLARPEAAILDVCCGTGDLTLALLQLRPQAARPILAVDFAHAMLCRGAQKFAGISSDGVNGSEAENVAPRVIPLEADALQLPLRDTSIDLIVTSFGFRNLANYEAGLREFHRVLKPGGQLGILEFGEPEGLIGAVYGIYFRRVLPAIGRMVCGKPGPYNYLPNSVGAFPRPAALVAMMESCGYADCKWQPFTFGIAGLYTALRPF